MPKNPSNGAPKPKSDPGESKGEPVEVVAVVVAVVGPAPAGGLLSLNQPGPSSVPNPPVGQIPDTKNWKLTHEKTLKSIRADRDGVVDGTVVDPTLDYVQCPHCGRRFNRQAAQKHIPACETMIHNKPAGKKH